MKVLSRLVPVIGAGQLTALGNTKTDAGTVGASAAGRFLYVPAGAAGIVAL